MIPYDIFIKDCSFSDIVVELTQFFGLSESERKLDDQGRLRFYRSDIEFVAYEGHKLVDDQGIPFSQFPLQVSLIKLVEGEGYSNYGEQVEAMARYLTEKFAVKLRGKSMLVANLSRILLSCADLNRHGSSASCTRPTSQWVHYLLELRLLWPNKRRQRK